MKICDYRIHIENSKVSRFGTIEWCEENGFNYK